MGFKSLFHQKNKTDSANNPSLTSTTTGDNNKLISVAFNVVEQDSVSNSGTGTSVQFASPDLCKNILTSGEVSKGQRLNVW
uniref:Uncharacterized protein n=1 Tax=Fagus sylvatica TaxID=28930 RepID=A0A2N9G3Z3_FAGSY